MQRTTTGEKVKDRKKDIICSPQTKLDTRRIKETITSGIGIVDGGAGSAGNFPSHYPLNRTIIIATCFQIVVKVILTWYLADNSRSQPCQKVEGRECAEADDVCCGYFCGVETHGVKRSGISLNIYQSNRCEAAAKYLEYDLIVPEERRHSDLRIVIPVGQRRVGKLRYWLPKLRHRG